MDPGWVAWVLGADEVRDVFDAGGAAWEAGSDETEGETSTGLGAVDVPAMDGPAGDAGAGGPVGRTDADGPIG
ncbi:hypothetical protein FAF44_47225 [Nonomuraea sp. MG754425]|uniref:hypothetical protein n=1 Tax=Nonomuraea sp. MG754425 TaxID=2570319 RepID=UPI001F490CFF|nr:hypothetical protein [Nonomuraea sp. MG754425]MCF6475881.1 hypothetical protein [Nonomuraea sp. MG754425]